MEFRVKFAQDSGLNYDTKKKNIMRKLTNEEFENMKNIDLLKFWKFSVLLAAVIFASSILQAKEESKNLGGNIQTLQKTTASQIPITILNINNVTSYFRADGQGNHNLADQSGFNYPRGTSTAIYEDGFVWGGKVYLDALHTSAATNYIRVGGQTYNQGTVQGPVIGTGAGAVAFDPADIRARAYRIRRDYYTMSDAELRADAATLKGILQSDVTAAQLDEVRAQYALDWAEWPTAWGAPYIERNGTPGYQAPPAFSSSFTVDNLISGNYDEPGIAGADPNSPADQVIWTVYNDLDPTAVFGLYQSDPIGLEGQVTIWGYKRSDAMGNIYFKRLKLINKGGVNIGTGNGSLYVDSMYVSQWSDPDLGDSGDDLCGCDTTLSLGFAYNGNPVDQEYKKFSLAPPAVGYDFFQGPIIKNASTIGQTGIFNLSKVSDAKNLPMTAFVYFSAGSPISDPRLNGQAGASYESTLRWYRMLRGLRPDASSIPERYYPFPPGTAGSRYPLSGDPVKQTGFVDGQGTDFSLVPGDRRIILASGPFELAPNDTQEVVVGTVAGIGSDRLSSISVLKFNDVFAQNTYDALFVVPKAPSQPKVKYTELDGQVVFEWGSDFTRVSATENTTAQPGDYTFEGYNVYQLPSAGSTLKDAKRVATYDLLTDPTVVLDQQVDDASGQILQKPVQFGSNSGISRYFVFNKDYVKDIPRINNGTEYYLAITAYSVSRSGYLPVSLESSPEVFRVTPQSSKPGSRWGASAVESQAIHHTGTGDAALSLRVIDPGQLTGQTYTVGFSTTPDNFSASYKNLGHEFNELDEFGDTTWTQFNRYVLSGTLGLNSAGTSVSYNLRISNLDSLSGPITGAQFQLGPVTNIVTYPPLIEFEDYINYLDIPTGTVLKTLTFKDSVISGLHNGFAIGSWTTTDATQPLTSAIVTAMNTGGLYVNILTAANPTGEAASVFQVLTYPWYLNRGTTRVLDYQQNLSYKPNAVVPDFSYAIVDGFQFRIGSLTFNAPTTISGSEQTVKVNPRTPAFVLAGDATYFAYSDGYATNFFGAGCGSSATLEDYQQDLEMRFTGVRADPNAEDCAIVAGGSIATVYSGNRAVKARMRIPFELWENDANGRTRQINCAIRDRNFDAALWSSSTLPQYVRFIGGRAYIEVINTAYNSDTAASAIEPINNNPMGTWFLVPSFTAGASHWDTGDILHISIPNQMLPGVDTYSWTTPPPTYSTDVAKTDINKVGVFPNPYYAFNPNEISRTTRFITFNRLPQKAVIRIFNLAGQLVRTLRKDDVTQFMQWNLANEDNFPVASGMYLAYVDMPGLGSKILKIALIQEQEVPNNF
jgi:hypothetical protein